MLAGLLIGDEMSESKTPITAAQAAGESTEQKIARLETELAAANAKLEAAERTLADARAAEAQPCCGEYFSCARTCVPRGRELGRREVIAELEKSLAAVIENVTKDEIEEFRLDALIRGPEPLPEWAEKENRVLNAICDYAIRALSPTQDAQASRLQDALNKVEP